MTCKLYNIAVLCFLLLLASCRFSDEKARTGADDYYRMVEGIEDSLSSSPSQSCALLDSLSVRATDSVTYYYIQIVKAKALMFLSEPDSAMTLLYKVDSFCSRSADSGKGMLALQARVCNMKGNLFARSAAIDSATVQFRRACGLLARIGNRQVLLGVCQNLADAYVRGGKYDSGAYWYRRSLSLADSLGIPEEQRFSIYYGLAQVNMELRDYEHCDYYYDLAGKYYEHMQPFEKHVYLNNRGNSYYYRGDYVTALSYFRRLMAFTSQYPDMDFERNLTMINMGETFLLMNRTDSAAYYLDRCYGYFQEVKNSSALYYIDTQLIELALKEGNLPLARQRLENAVVPDFVEPNMVRIRNRYLQHYFAEIGDYKQAYHYQQENQRMDDSTRNERVKMRVAEIVQKYLQDSTLMKKEMLIKQKQNEVLFLNERLYRVGLFVLLLLAIMVVAVLYRERRRDETDREMRRAITSLKLENIRNRISPHFIFNVLSREMDLQRNDRTESNLSGLVKLIRRNLELTNDLAVTLADELDFVHTYIGLEEKTLQPGFTYMEEITEGLDLTAIKVPSMLLQIPVENAVKHALRGKEGLRKLWIRIRKETESMDITICDNGGGFRNISPAKGTGTGMKVITQTIQLLNSYNKHAIVMTINNISIEKGETGCEVRFILPLDYSYKQKRKKG